MDVTKGAFMMMESSNTIFNSFCPSDPIMVQAILLMLGTETLTYWQLDPLKHIPVTFELGYPTID